MEIKVLSDKTNGLLKRREISFAIMQEAGTAKRDEAKQQICKTLNLNPEGTVVVSIEQEFGMKRSVAVAHSYQSKDLMERSEQKHIMNRVAGVKGRPAGSGKKAAPAAQASAEGKK